MTTDFMTYEASTRNKDKWAEMIHAYKANKARAEQLTVFNEESSWQEIEMPTPRAFCKKPYSYLELIKNILKPFNLIQYLP